MAEDLRLMLGDLPKSSHFLASLKSLAGAGGRSRLFGNEVRSLSDEEVGRLKVQGNRCADWSRVRVEAGFKTDFVFDSTFAGDCVLGAFNGLETRIDESSALPSGIYGSTIMASEIGSDCLVYGTGIISNYMIRDRSVVFRVGALTAPGKNTFGNGREIAVGIETGGREILSYAELTIPVAEAVAVRRGDAEFLRAYGDFVKAYLESCTVPFGVVESGSLILNTPKIEGAYVGEGVVIDGAALVQNSTALGAPDEPTGISHGAYVRNSCLQWGCEVTSLAIVDDSVLTEYSHVERHAKVTQSIIGPNTGVAEGEITASLVGPFVGFHHQALLIAAIWPEGKGNVGYGANVGSNHTSKAPDQEIWCGEGFFFGLGVNVKFPSDFTCAPYSIIATAVDTLPQKVAFPFSLINKPSRTFDGVPVSYNEISPAWVLYDNIYTVRRNEGKYKKRNKALRTAFEFDVFRPETIGLMIEARNRLRSVISPKECYTDQDVGGLGKNCMLEESRIKGIEAYGFYIEYYALRGLERRISELLEGGKEAGVGSVYDETTGDPKWENQRSVLLAEGFDRRSVPENLERLSEIQERITRDTERSKERDDVRGRKIIRDYEAANTQAADDAFVRETREESRRYKERLRELIARLPS